MGDWFVESILADIETLAPFRGIHWQQGGFHKMHASKFQCAIYYRDVAGRAEVVAILDLRINPSWLRRQLLKR